MAAAFIIVAIGIIVFLAGYCIGEVAALNKVVNMLEANRAKRTSVQELNPDKWK